MNPPRQRRPARAAEARRVEVCARRSGRIRPRPESGRLDSLYERRRVPERPARSAAVRFRPMFDALSNRLQDALGDLGRRSRLDEETVTRATREIRLALLEADVDFEVVKEFVASIRERALGQDVLKGLDPGQQVVKIVHEELTELMGSADSKLAFGRPPRSSSSAASRARGRRRPPPSSRSICASTREDAGPGRRRPPAPRGDRPARAARPPAPGAGLPHRDHRRRRRGA